MTSDGSTSLRAVLFTDFPGIVRAHTEFFRQRGHRLVGVVTSPGPKRRRGAGYLGVVQDTPPGIDLIVTNHPDRLAAMLAPMRPDLIVCINFPWKIPDDLLALPPHGVINTHPSLLPKYRGPNSAGWTFRNDDGIFGITVHRMTSTFDTGSILAQATIPYGDDDDIDTLVPKYLGVYFDVMLPSALERIARGEEGEAQREEEAVYAAMFEPEWQMIDWRNPARKVHNQVRSWIGIRDFPRGAVGEIDGVLTRVIKTKLVADTGHRPASPGTVLSRDGETLLIQCGDRPLQILRHQPESRV